MFVPCNTPSWIEGKHLGAEQVAGYWKLGMNNSTSPRVCGSRHVQRAGQHAPHPCLQSPVLLDAGARGPCSRRGNDQLSGLQQLYRFVKWGPPSIRSPFCALARAITAVQNLISVFLLPRDGTTIPPSPRQPSPALLNGLKCPASYKPVLSKGGRAKPWGFMHPQSNCGHLWARLGAKTYALFIYRYPRRIRWFTGNRSLLLLIQQQTRIHPRG